MEPAAAVEQPPGPAALRRVPHGACVHRRQHAMTIMESRPAAADQAPGAELPLLLGALIAMRLRTASKIPRCAPVLRRARGLQR